MTFAQPTPKKRQPPPSKPATAAWFVLRPYTYRHLFELLRRRARPRLRQLEASGPAAEEWGAAIARPVPDALEAILGPGSYPSPATLHAQAFADARQRAEGTGAEMGGAGNLDLLYHVVRALEARQVVETGVAFGWSSLAILLAQSSFGGGRLASTDMPYPRMGNERFVGCVVPESLRQSWTLIRRPDRPGLARALASVGPPDVVHYDSDKTYAGQSWAFRVIWKALRPGGILIADDIQYQTAFRDFATETRVEPLVVDGGGKLIGVIRRAG